MKRRLSLSPSYVKDKLSAKDSLLSMRRSVWWSAQTMLTYPVVQVLLLLFFGAVDYATLNILFDTNMQADKELIAITALGACMLENVFALAAGHLYHKAVVSKNPRMRKLLLLSVVIVTGFLLVLFAFRFSARDTLAVTQTPDLTPEGTGTGSSTAAWLAITLGVQPFVTSAFSFLLGVFDDPVRKKERVLQESLICLDDQIAVSKASIQEMELFSADADIQYLEHSYQLALEYVDDLAGEWKEVACQALQERINAQPEQLTTITNSTRAKGEIALFPAV